MLQDAKNNEGIDLSGALKDSGTGVKLADNSWQTMRHDASTTPKIIQWVMRYSGGLAKNEKQANYVLLAFVAVAVAISLVLVFGGSSGKSNPDKIIDFPELQRQNAQ